MLNYSVVVEVSAGEECKRYELTTKLEEKIGLRSLVDKAEKDFSNYLTSIGYKVIRERNLALKNGKLENIITSWRNPDTLFN